MKKILILETAASYHGLKTGGSYIQAKYYNELLKQKGYESKFYISHPYDNKLFKVLSIIGEIKKSDYIIGFGTPLFNIYLQWLSFIFQKKGIFCIDTIIVPIEIINDHINKKIYKKRFLLLGIYHYLNDNLIVNIPPPRLNLVCLSSSQYVKDKLKKTSFYSKGENFLYPKVEIIESKLKEKPKNKKVLFYGTLYRGRGIIDLLNACRILWQKKYKFKLLIFGWPIEPITEKTIIAEIKDEEKEHIMIKQKEQNILKLVNDSTVVVLPFRYPCSFQTPYTLLEPMGMGVPVITTNVGSHAEFIQNGKTGLICEKENPNDLADKIEAVFKDKKLVNRITKGAYNLLKKRYKEKDLLLETLRKLDDER